MSPQAPLLVFAAMDGVLAASSRAAFAEASCVLAPFASDELAIVFCSAHTRAEIERYYAALRCQHPFISENGAAVFVPDGYFPFELAASRRVAGYHAVEWGRPHREVSAAVRRAAVRARVEIRCFSDMSVEELSHELDVTPLQAQLAQLREYSEVFRIESQEPGAQARLADAVRRAHLHYLPGRKYDRVGTDVDASAGRSLLGRLYRQTYGRTRSLGFADPASDGGLLRLVDQAVPIERRASSAGGHAASRTSVAVHDVAEWATLVAETADVLHSTQESAT